LAVPYVGRRKAGTATLHSVRIIDIPSLADEHIEPSLSAVRRALIGDTGEPAAVPHQQRIFSFAVLGQKILHVHLLDLIKPIRINFGRNTTCAEHNLLHRLAGYLHDTTADMERTHVAQSDRFSSHCGPDCSAQQNRKQQFTHRFSPGVCCRGQSDLWGSAWREFKREKRPKRGPSPATHLALA